jgi:CRP-like cAMP-binding protein
MSQENLIALFNNYITLDSMEVKALIDICIEKKVRRKQYILQEREVCKYYTFVAVGLLKMFVSDKKDMKHNIQFAIENEWITDIGSLHSKKPSFMNIEAIEDSIIIQIKHKDLHDLISMFPKLERIFRVIIENKYIKMEERISQNLCLATEEKYISLLDQNQLLANRLPNTQIASYLGITPEFLSKVRRNMAKKT